MEIITKSVYKIKDKQGFSFGDPYPLGYWYEGSWRECKDFYLDEFGSDFEDCKIEFMFHISPSDYSKIPRDFRSVFRGIGNGANRPEYIGKRTMFKGCFTGEPGCVLIIEDKHFVIDEELS